MTWAFYFAESIKAGRREFSQDPINTPITLSLNQYTWSSLLCPCELLPLLLYCSSASLLSPGVLSLLHHQFSSLLDFSHQHTNELFFFLILQEQKLKLKSALTPFHFNSHHPISCLSKFFPKTWWCCLQSLFPYSLMNPFYHITPILWPRSPTSSMLLIQWFISHLIYQWGDIML